MIFTHPTYFCSYESLIKYIKQSILIWSGLGDKRDPVPGEDASTEVKYSKNYIKKT